MGHLFPLVSFQKIFLRKGQILKTICFTACHFPLEESFSRSFSVRHECILVRTDQFQERTGGGGTDGALPCLALCRLSLQVTLLFQTLAINRGENLKILTVKVNIPDRVKNDFCRWCINVRSAHTHNAHTRTTPHLLPLSLVVWSSAVAGLMGKGLVTDFYSHRF